MLAAALLAPRAGVAQPPDSAPPPARERFWIRPVASLLVPGMGQLLGHADRGAIYIATELYGLSRFIQVTHDARRERDRYRDLAFVVARRGLAGMVRRDTVFEYYETLERFTASGGYDTDAGPAFVPESDPTTYNGSVWLLARRTFWTDPNSPPDPSSPEYQRALQFYQTHAVGPDFRWSWRDASLEQEVFRETIRRSDNAFRSAQNQLGILLANHVLSMVDALISSRFTAAARRPAALRASVGRPAVVELRLAF